MTKLKISNVTVNPRQYKNRFKTAYKESAELTIKPIIEMRYAL